MIKPGYDPRREVHFESIKDNSTNQQRVSVDLSWRSMVQNTRWNAQKTKYQIEPDGLLSGKFD